MSTYWSGTADDKLYIQSLFTSTMLDSLSVASISTSPTGVFVDLLADTNFSSDPASGDKIYKLSAFTTTIINSISVASVETSPSDCSIDANEDTLMAGNADDKLYKFSAFTSTLIDSLSVGGVEATPTGVTSDSVGNTLWSGSTDDKLYKFSAFTTTLLDSIAVGTVDTVPSGISWDGTNTIWSGSTDDKLYKQSVFTSTLISSVSVGAVDTAPNGIDHGDPFERLGITAAPLIECRENSDVGTLIVENEAATGNRAFGSQQVSAGPTANATIAILNTGTATLNIASVVLAGTDPTQFSIDTTGLDTTIAGGDFSTFTANFNPTTTGAKSAVIQIDHDAANENDPYRINVSGTGLADAPLVNVYETTAGGTEIAENEAAGSIRAFGSRDIGDGPSAYAVIVIRNEGFALLTLGTPTEAAGDTGEFELDVTGFDTTLNNGETTSFQVRFDPTTVGAKTLRVDFTHDDGTVTSPFRVNFSGTGVSEGRIELRETDGSGTIIAENAAAASTRAFGSQDTSAGPTAYAVFAVRNKGSANLSIASITEAAGDTGEFELDTTGFTSPIAPGAYQTFQVRFDPTTLGAKTLRVDIDHDATNETDPFRVNFSGTGVSTANIECREDDDTGTLIVENEAATGNRAFGSQDVLAGPTSPITIAVRNTGSAVMNVTTPTLSGADASEFAINAAGYGPQIGAGNFHTFQITFDPSTVAAKTATCNVAHDADNENDPFRINLSGTGTGNADIHVYDETGDEIISSSVCFGARDFGPKNVNYGPGTPLRIKVTNDGAGSLTLGTPTVATGDTTHFGVVTTDFLTTLAAGESTVFDIFFDPQSTGSKTATVEFAQSDAGVEDPFVIEVCGEGVTSPPSRFWVGQATEVAQVSQVKITAYHTSTTYAVTIGGQTVSVLGQGGTVATTAAALLAALQAETHPYFSELVFSGTGEFITITAGVPGIPFDATTSATGGTGTMTNAVIFQKNVGPNAWDSRDNWNEHRIPQPGDDVVVLESAENIVWGLNQEDVQLFALTIRRNYTGLLGLNWRIFATDASGTVGPSTVREYREHYLRIDCDSAVLGEIFNAVDSDGSARIKIDFGTIETTVEIQSTADAPAISSDSAVMLKMDHAASTVFVRSAPGGVGIGTDEPGEPCELSSVSVSGSDVEVYVGQSVTIDSWYQGGGDNLLQSLADMTLVDCDGGTLQIEGQFSIATLAVEGGEVLAGNVPTSGDAIDTAVVGAGTLNMLSSNEPRTIGTLTLGRDSSYNADGSVVTAGAISVGVNVFEMKVGDATHG